MVKKYLRPPGLEISKLIFLLPLLSIAVLIMVDISSIFSYFYTLLLFLIISKFICKDFFILNFEYFHYYLFIAIFIYVAQKSLIPHYMGLSGWTDDEGYYAQFVDGNVMYSTHHLRREIYPFVTFLKILYPFHAESPLNIIIVNLLGIAYLPFYIFKFTKYVWGDTSIAYKAASLFLICPYSTYIGCIIMRDMWIATFIVAGLYYFSNKKYIPFVLYTLLIVFIRFGSIVFLGGGLLILVKDRIYHMFKYRINGFIFFLFIILLLVSVLILVFPYLQEYSGGKLESGLIRSTFVEVLEAMDGNAIILKLFFLPFPVNIASLTLFFFFCPFLNFTLNNEGHFLVSNLFNSLLTPIFFFFLWNPIIRTSLQGILFKKHRTVKTILYIVLIMTLLLGTVSLQVRHKTVLFPFLCMLAAYGLVDKDKRCSKLSTLLTVLVIATQLLFVII